ncbi:hypothetical protein ACLOJK_015158 [Asimina triloba]
MFAGGEETDLGGDACCCWNGRMRGAAGRGHVDADDGRYLWTWMDHGRRMGVGRCMPLMGSLLTVSCCQASDGIGELVVVRWAGSADLRWRWKKVLLAVASTGRGRLATVGCWTEEAWLVWNCYPHRIAPPWPDLAVMMGEVLAAVENQRGDGGGALPIVRRMGRGGDAVSAIEVAVVGGGSSSCSKKTMEKEGEGSCCRRLLAHLLPDDGWMRRTGHHRYCRCLAVGARCRQAMEHRVWCSGGAP